MAKFEIHDNIKNRWSPYSFSLRPLDPEKLISILKASQFAPSSYNEQPWIIVYAERDDEDSFNSFLGFLDDANRVWAKDSGALIAVLARKKLSFSGEENFYALHDTGMAVGNMLNQATFLGVDMHVMGGFSRASLKEYFSLDTEIVPVVMIAAGHYGENASLPDDVAMKDKRRRGRKPFEEVVLKNSAYSGSSGTIKRPF